MRLIWGHRLPEWSGLARGRTINTTKATEFVEGVHDFMPFELAWEVLI